jgi:phosphatidylinositol kinase/protein kinase (PI-3  family)
MEDDDLCDWENISDEEIKKAYDESLRPPPDILTDPFKEKWKNTKKSYQNISRFGHCKTYLLKPMIVKANDDCRQEVIAIQLMKRL